jgi:hypothetical protein
MVLRKPAAASAAVLAALTIAVPAAGASAAVAAPAVRTAPVVLHGHHNAVRHGQREIAAGFDPGSLFCDFLVHQLIAAAQSGNLPLANAIANVTIYLCPNPAI